ncbi:hypothetical protein BU25DRAFT_407743 [Macroventuria anomochaeta]|uniref:Uncharacterized protein n=1 Tax=Macroventuria anomochaeta TaxID=301207 RepID=A0ACB6SD24_9PLEO|nr:uncharacterized protein BU25DRAFT_407743 [Macroventuria anomochaeta]KAF2631214.1 hypothetical protein BU25DRAFT_407743 [Macroventuria anomochaeta]
MRLTSAVYSNLNYKWGKNGGPKSFWGKVTLWTVTVAGSLVGFKYYKAQMYAGLGCLWVVPWMSSQSLLLSGLL